MQENHGLFVVVQIKELMGSNLLKYEKYMCTSKENGVRP